MRALARRRGNVNQVSGMQDTHRADVMVSAVFGLGEKGFEPSVLGTVPPTGTMLHLVNDEILDLLLNRYKNEIFYLGRIYGSETKLPCGSSILAQVRQVLVKLITLVCLAEQALANLFWQK